MRTSRAIAAVAGLMLVLAVSARAEQPGPYVGPYAGPYGGLGAGATLLPETPLRGGSASNDVNNGWATIGSVGLALHRNWRAEVEIGYRRDNAQALTDRTGVNAWGGMGNVLFDVNTASGWTPYVGAGIGALRYRASGLHASSGGFSDDDLALAYQGVVGVSYAITPNSRFFFDYRYLRMNDPSPAGNTPHTDSSSSTVLLGFRFTLSPPPATDR